MADKKISEMTAATSLDGTEYLPIVVPATPGDLNQRVTVDNLTAFVTSDLPASIYKAVLSQSGTGAPTATVIKNTLSGAPVWSRVSEGVYRCTLASAFTSNKTFLTANIVKGQVGNESSCDIKWISANVVELRVTDFGDNVVDGFSTLWVLIEVYT